MAFDYEGALAAGYSPSEIADYLGKNKKFDVSGARKAGYDDFEIISHLSTPTVTAPKAAQKEGFLPGLKEGVIGAAQATARGVTAPFQSEEDIRSGYAAQKAAAEERNVAYTPFSAIPEAYEKEGLGAAAGTTYKAARDALSRSLPFMAPVIAGSATGARIGAMGGPYAPVTVPLGAIVGGIAGGLPQFAGTNIERRIEEKTPGPLVTPEVYQTALGQASLDTAATMFTLGTGLVAKVVGRPIANVSEQQLLRTAERSLTGTLARGAGRGAISEMPTEVAQQILERRQAGLDLTSEDAYREYGEVAAAAGVLGAGMGGVGNIVTRGQARGKLSEQEQARDLELAAIAQERARIAGIAATAQASQQARLRAEEQALAAREAELRKPLTEQMELDLAPETTVEEVAAKRTAESPQGDLFTGMPEAVEAAPVAEEVTPSLNDDTIKSFGFKKNSLAYKAMETLNNPELTPQEQVKRFDQIIENNQEKIKTKEQEEAVTKFKQFMDQRLAKEQADELRTVDSRPVGESADLFGGTDTAELSGRTGEPVGDRMAGVGTDVGTAEVGADEVTAPLEAQAPQTQEVIQAPRMTAGERQQRLIEQRLEEEAARKAEKEANLAAAKEEQGGFREAEVLPEAEREGLQAAKEFEEAPDVDMSQRVEQGAGTTVDAVNESLKDWAISPEEAAPAMEVVPSVAELPADVKSVIGREARNRGITPGVIQAFTHKGKAYLIADRIKPGTERSVFMHEVGVHRGMSKNDINTVANKVNRWATAKEGSLERTVSDAVQRRMEAAKEVSNEELVAYAVEEAANAGVTPTAALRAKNIPANGVVAMVKQLAQRFMDVAREVFNKPAATPTVQDLVDFVYGSAKKTMDKGPAKVEAEPRLSATSTEPTGDNIFRDLVSPRVKDARLNLGAAVRAITPKLLSMYQLVDQFGAEMPALQQYSELNDKMTMTQQRLKNKAQSLLSEWGAFSFKNPVMHKKLGKLMLDATRSRIHPDEEIGSEANAHVTEDMADTYEQLSNAYNALSPEAKQIYQRARALLQENFNLRRTTYNDMVRGAYAEDLAEATPEEAAKINARVEKAIQEHELLLNEMRGPYFPLMRFGEYLVVAESDELRSLREDLANAEGTERKRMIEMLRQMEQSDDHYQVHAFEKRSEQAREANRLKNTGMNIRETKSEDYMSNIRANSFGAIDQLEKIFDREIDLDVDPAQMRQLRQAMIDSVLAGLPENSALQRQIKRRNIAGATENMLQAFAETMERDSHYLSRMGYMKPLSKSLIDMRNQSKNDMQLRDVYNTSVHV
jgi:hypothetical protein